MHIFDTVYREMKCGIERGTLGDEPVYFATFNYYSSFVEEPCQLLFPFCELSCQMASNAFSNRVFVNIWGHIEKPLLLLSNVNILCGNCFWQHSTSRGDNKSYFRKCGKNRWASLMLESFLPRASIRTRTCKVSRLCSLALHTPEKPSTSNSNLAFQTIFN